MGKIEEVIEGFDIKPVSELEENLTKLPPEHFSSYYNQCFRSVLGLTEELSKGGSCSSMCSKESLEIINLAYIRILSKSIKKTFMIFNPSTNEIDVVPDIKESVYKTATAFIKRKDLPPECNDHISKLDERVQSETKKIAYMVFGLALNYLHLFGESLRSAKILETYGRLKGDDIIEKYSKEYLGIAKKCLARFSHLPLSRALKEHIINTYNECNKQSLKLPAYGSKQKYLKL